MVRNVFEDILKTVRKSVTSYKQLSLLVHNLVQKCSKGQITCLFDVTAFSRNVFNAGSEFLTCTIHMICIDIGYYSNNGHFQRINRIVRKLISIPFNTATYVIVKEIQVWLVRWLHDWCVEVVQIGRHPIYGHHWCVSRFKFLLKNIQPFIVYSAS